MIAELGLMATSNFDYYRIAVGLALLSMRWEISRWLPVLG
jgi:hypothetical protein